MEKLTTNLKIALRDINHFNVGYHSDSQGYPSYWKPQSRKKLVAMGLVEQFNGHYGPESFRLTDEGKTVLASLP